MSLHYLVKLKMLVAFKLSGIDICPSEIPRTEWTGNTVAIQDGIDNMTIDSY